MQDDLERAFIAPGEAVRPLLRWWWPGGAVDADALCAQLRAFHAAGWGGVEIQPFRVGLPHALPAAVAQRVHDVFTPRWFQTVAAVMAEARRLGMTVDTTFGSCWPMGGGEAVTPELAAQELSLAWTSVQGPQRWQGRPQTPTRPARFGTRMERDGSVDPLQALPEDWPARIDALTQTVAVLALKGSTPSFGPFAGFVPLTLPDLWQQVIAAGWVDAASTADLTDRLQADGRLDWDVPEGRWQIVVVRRFVSDQRITESAGAGPQLVIDHLKRSAFDVHAARVGDAALVHWAPFAGSTWRSVFVDSLELPTDLHWTDDFAAEFERRRGYALRPFLPLLLQPGWRNCFQARFGAPLFDDADTGPRVRADYRLTVSELMIERHYGALAEWAALHGLQAKTQAHGAPVDWLQAYGTAGLPETEDLAGGAAPHFLRVARSAAHLYGRRLVTAEAFCWLLDGLAVTPQQLRERADAFFVHGVQQLIGHGASAPIAGAGDSAGWYPFAAMEIGTVLDERNPLWPMLRPLTDHIARCQAVLQRGRAVVRVAVLAPLDLFAFMGAADRLTPPAWHDALLDAGHDWDWINADGLLKGRLDEGALVSPGGHRYAALVLPELPALRAEVAERLAACAEAGVPVLAIGAAPSREEGWLDAAARDQRVQAAMRRALGTRRPVPPSAIGRALHEAGVAPVLDLPPGHGLEFSVRDEGERRWVFLRNPTAQPARAEIRAGPGRGVVHWHTWTGCIDRLDLDAQGVGQLTMPPRSARLLCLDPSAAAWPVAPRWAAAPTPRQDRPLDGPWTLQAHGRGLGGRVMALDTVWSQLLNLSQQPSLADFAGLLRYGQRFVLSAEELAAGPLWLDLGAVHDAARVQVNDAPPITACEAPFLFDIAAALRPGENTLSVEVANRPENAWRDPQHPGGLPLPGRRLTRLPTGLLGPVRLIGAPAPVTRWRLR